MTILLLFLTLSIAAFWAITRREESRKANFAINGNFYSFSSDDLSSGEAKETKEAQSSSAPKPIRPQLKPKRVLTPRKEVKADEATSPVEEQSEAAASVEAPKAAPAPIKKPMLKPRLKSAPAPAPAPAPEPTPTPTPEPVVEEISASKQDELIANLAAEFAAELEADSTQTPSEPVVSASAKKEVDDSAEATEIIAPIAAPIPAAPATPPVAPTPPAPPIPQKEAESEETLFEAPIPFVAPSEDETLLFPPSSEDETLPIPQSEEQKPVTPTKPAKPAKVKKSKPANDNSKAGGKKISMKFVYIGIATFLVLILAAGGVYAYMNIDDLKELFANNKRPSVTESSAESSASDQLQTETEADLLAEAALEAQEQVAQVVEPEPEPEPEPKPVVSIPTQLKLGYGTYEGDISGGKANGLGKMVYSTRTLISQFDSKKRYAEAGQYVVGTWYSNNLDFGRLYDANGVLLETLTIGRAE